MQKIESWWLTIAEDIGHQKLLGFFVFLLKGVDTDYMVLLFSPQLYKTWFWAAELWVSSFCVSLQESSVKCKWAFLAGKAMKGVLGEQGMLVNIACACASMYSNHQEKKKCAKEETKCAHCAP